ncbi:MAG: hypothetical protein HWE26_05060 [Alteromonadaceae bacterium]|nr:hypothetical protein [Alteromonadaceae bacterium]
MSKMDAIGSEITSEPEESSKEEAIFEHTDGQDRGDHLAHLRHEQLQKLKVDNLNLQALNTLRLKLAKFIFRLIVGWLVAVMLLVFLGSYEIFVFTGECPNQTNTWFGNVQSLPSGCNYLTSKTYLNLSETIVVALITTTTINVLGLSFIVAKWLFPSTSSKGVNSKPEL